jgi:hypothetical protein
MSNSVRIRPLKAENGRVTQQLVYPEPLPPVLTIEEGDAAVAQPGRGILRRLASWGVLALIIAFIAIAGASLAPAQTTSSPVPAAIGAAERAFLTGLSPIERLCLSEAPGGDAIQRIGNWQLVIVAGANGAPPTLAWRQLPSLPSGFDCGPILRRRTDAIFIDHVSTWTRIEGPGFEGLISPDGRQGFTRLK